MDTDIDKTIAGRARHFRLHLIPARQAVRAVLCVLTDGGQRTARPTNQSVFIRVHPWLNLKPPRTPAHGCERVEDKRIVGKEGNGMANPGAQSTQPRTGEL